MSLPSLVYVLRCLVRDTFRQSLATRTFWLILFLSGMGILFCLSVRIEGVTAWKPPGEIELYGADDQPYTGLNRGEGALSLAFGAIRLRLFRDGETEVVFLQTLLAKWGASAVGILLVLLWTSGFLPEFLQPQAATVLLAKPVPRWVLLAGKYLGVLAFVSFHALVFVGGTWLALGLRTGFWTPGYLFCIPLLVLEFAFLYGVSTLLAVWTRSTVVCLVGVLVFWGVCASLNFTRHAFVTQPDPPQPAAVLVEAGYWALPKPADISYFLSQLLHSERHFQERPEFLAAEANHQLEPSLSLVTSFVFTAAVLALAGRRLARAEY
jgi:ABC-type transport system involved in multi-copper enzyme maturation permease subunit